MNEEITEDLKGVEKVEKCPYGLCPVCAEPNHKPMLWKMIYVCNQCFLSRTEDCMEIIKAYKKLEELKNEERMRKEK